MPPSQEAALAEVTALSTSIWGDLDEGGGGVGWWAGYAINPADRFDLSDYLYGVVDGIGTHLGIAEKYLHEYRAIRKTDDFHLRAWTRANRDQQPWLYFATFDARSRKHAMAAHVYSFFNAASSVLDTLAGAVIGVAGLNLPLAKADLGMFAPVTSDTDYPTGTNRARKSLSPHPAALKAQIELVRAFRTSLIHAGPADWHLWLNLKRNQLAHRGGRLQMETLPRRPHSWDLDRYIVFDRDPHLTTTQSFRNNAKQDMDTIFLLEDQLTTMEGILGSLQTAIIGTIVPCRTLWDRRRENPDLIQQPAGQWVQPKDNVNFPGYDPHTGFFGSLNTMVMNPIDSTRLNASQVLDNQSSRRR